MSEKMLVTQALDERDLLVKKINSKIAKASFVDTIKPNEEKVFAGNMKKEDYAKEAEAAFQQIMDLIDRYQKIDAAIVASNASTFVTLPTELTPWPVRSHCETDCVEKAPTAERQTLKKRLQTR